MGLLKKRFPLLLILLVVVVGGGLIWQQAHELIAASVANAQTPTDVPVTATSTPTVTLTIQPSNTLTAIPTATETPTTTPTLTEIPSITPTLATLVIHLTAVNPDIVLPTEDAVGPTLTPLPPATDDVPPPPTDIPFMPTGTFVPLRGWYAYAVTDPTIQYTGKWQAFTSTYRSDHHQYMYTDDAGAGLHFRFLGAGLRLRYVSYFTYGVFQVAIDGQILDTIDSYYPKQLDGFGNFPSTTVFALANGWHDLDVTRLGADHKNPDSAGTIIGIDGIEVYQDGAAPTATGTALPSATATLTPSPRPAQHIDVVLAPPTVQPTVTTAPPGVLSISLIVAYDAKANKVADPSEGVQGISAHLVAITTNQVVTSGVTNAEGFVDLEATTSQPLRLVVPYLGKSWDIPPGTTGQMQFVLLVPAANQPALIP